MDIEIKTKKTLSPVLIVSCLIMMLLLILALWLVKKGGAVEQNGLKFDKVGYSHIKNVILLNGKLKSSVTRVATSKVQGVVKEVLKRPGEIVVVGDVLVNIENQDLTNEVARNVQAVEEQRLKNKELILEQSLAVLDMETEINRVEGELSIVSVRLENESALQAKGIVSKMKLMETEFKQGQYQKHLEMLIKKLSDVKMIHETQLANANIKIKHLRNQVILSKKRLDELQIRAEMNGVVQDINVNLGETLEIGSTIAKISNTEQLLAELRVPQGRINEVIYGAPVELSVYGSVNEIQAEVTRIEPIVKNGYFTVEALLHGGKDGLRPMLDVKGRIVINEIPNSLAVRAPYGVSENSKKEVYVVSDGFLKKRIVTFGHQYEGMIQVLDGLQDGDVVLVTESKSFEHLESVRLVERG